MTLNHAKLTDGEFSPLYDNINNAGVFLTSAPIDLLEMLNCPSLMHEIVDKERDLYRP